MKDFIVRYATHKDIDFIVEAIIQAEKSYTDKLGLSTIFNVSEENVRKYLVEILQEDIEGCEFSLGSFLVVDTGKRAVAAIAGWKEQANEDELPSSILKSNLIHFFFPKQSIVYAGEMKKIIEKIQIERTINAYQIEYVYVDKNYRGNNLAAILLNEHVKQAKVLNCNLIEVQVFANNKPAIVTYQKLDFTVARTFASDNNEILNLLPYNEKLLMQKTIDI